MPGFDYSKPGGYFATICVHDGKCDLGDVVEGKARLSPCGEIIRAVWSDLPRRFAGIRADHFVVMPNHFHGIVIIECTDRVGAQLIAPAGGTGAIAGTGAMNCAPTKPRAPTLGEIVRAFKAVTTRRIRQEVLPTFAWQRNYYEHVIRNDADLLRIRQYIADNPAQWDLDENHPGKRAQ